VHTKFEVSSFSCSKDIRAHILKLLVSSAILDSTISGFRQFGSFQSATEYHVVFEHICPCVAELELFFQLSHFRGLNWDNESQSWGPSCMWSAADNSTDISVIHSVFKSKRSECESVKKIH